jgi:phospholipase/lecithinase/hemolysin
MNIRTCAWLCGIFLFTQINAAPLTLTQTNLPATVVANKSYTVKYRFLNNSDHPQTYTITPASSRHDDSVTVLPVKQSCNVKNQQTVLLAKETCVIKLRFAAIRMTRGQDHRALIEKVFQLSADAPIKHGKREQKVEAVYLDSTEENSFHNVIVFGDSLSDINGRNTNNIEPKLWDEDVITKLQDSDRLEVKKSAIVGTDNTDSLNENVIFARSGKTTEDLDRQIESFKSSLKGKDANNNSLVFIWLGGNDLAGGSLDLLGKFISNINNGIGKLKGLGIEESQIVLIDLPNLGNIPKVYTQSAQVRNALCKASESFNQQLLALAKAQNVHFIDISARNKATFEGTRPDDFYREDNALYKQCKTSTAGSKCMVSVNGKKEYYMMYDGMHPTVYGHKVLADYIYEHTDADSPEESTKNDC